MTAVITENPPENLADDTLYADEPEGMEDVDAGQEDAPYGYMRDPKTGEIRPKKSPGRPKTPRSAEELRAGEPPPAPAEDRAPDETKRPAKTLTDEDVPMPRGGVIAKGVDRLYRRAGRIVRKMDDDIGTAIIEITLPDPEDADALTVGQAWEALAKDSPRIRKWLLRLIKGGGLQDLIMCHAPVAMAIFMKPRVAALLMKMPLLGKLAAGFLEGDGEDGGLTEDDARKLADRMGIDIEEVARRVASGNLRGVPRDHLPPQRRNQPRRRSRAARHK